MKTGYGNSFSSGKKETLSLSVEDIWIQADKFYPNGVWVAKDGTNTEGKKIPAGTPIGINAGAVEIDSETPIALNYEDAYVGSDGCSLTLVVNGTINESLYEGTAYSSEQKAALPGITFYKEA